MSAQDPGLLLTDVIEMEQFPAKIQPKQRYFILYYYYF